MTSIISAAAEASSSTASEIQSDFNGDGYDDLVIGVPLEDIDTKSNAGAVSVLYGSNVGGLQTTSPADQFWHQNSPGLEDNPEFDDQFGSSLAVGDFNGDGFSDLAIGVPRENIGTISNGGAVNVLYGSSSGLRTAAAGDGTGRADQFWNQNSAGVENTVQAHDSFGSSLAAGDFNGDGRDDLAIGVPGEDVGAISDGGAVSVLYGSASGLQSASPADQLWHQNSPGVLDTAESYDGFGSSLAAGDFNGDGRDDLAIGVPGDVGAISGGAVNILYGSEAGLQSTSPADQVWHQNSPGVEDSAEYSDFFSRSLAAGDFNGDGFDDLAIGAPFEDLGSIFDAGTVHVLYGSASGLQTSSPSDQLWNQNSPGVEDAAEESEQLGYTVSAGDFNGDGFDDLAIGVPQENLRGDDNVGTVNVIYGSPSGLGTSSPADQFWTQDSPGVDDSAGGSDDFGRSVAAGDFNGDGRDDLAIGVPIEKIGTVVRAGAVNVLYGSSSSGLQTTSPADQFWNQNTPGVEDTAEFEDLFGCTLTEVHVTGVCL